MEKNIDSVFQSNRPVHFEDEQEEKYDGTAIYPIFDVNHRIAMLVAFAKDITVHKRLQDQLIKSEKLAATGKLAAYIAHEINSPLQGISSLLNVIRESNESNKELSNCLNLIEGGFEQIKNTVEKLLDVTRPGKEEKQQIDVNKLIKDTIVLVQSHLKKKKIKINIHQSSKVPAIIASPQQLGQVFLNLINNAVEAITMDALHKGSGKQQSQVHEEITISTKLKKGNIIIRVSDTGPGIAVKNI